jgi:hypothetical protein
MEEPSSNWHAVLASGYGKEGAGARTVGTKASPRSCRVAAEDDEDPTPTATSIAGAAEHTLHTRPSLAQPTSQPSPQPANHPVQPPFATLSPKVASDPPPAELVSPAAESLPANLAPEPATPRLNVVSSPPAGKPASKLTSEPAQEPLPTPPATKSLPSSTKSLPSSTKSLPSTTKSLPSTTKSLPSATKSLPFEPTLKPQPTAAATKLTPCSSSLGQRAIGFSTLGQRAVAEMLASEAFRTGTVRDGMRFLSEKRGSRAKRTPTKLFQAFDQPRNQQAPSKKPRRSNNVVQKKQTNAQRADVRPAAKKCESSSLRRPTPSPHPPSRRFHHASWPAKVASIRQQYNPLEICFEYETPFAGFCGCDSPCRHDTCRNGILGIYCAPNCCLYDGKCGNGLAEVDNVKLVRRDQSSELAVVATAPIEKGMVIGQYLGKFITLDIDDNHSSSDDFENLAVPTLNTGYRYEFKRDSTSHPAVKIFIDAEKYRCIARFFNHSCKAAAQFREVRNGSRHTVVVVAVRDIKSGEEITVDYGTDIWFVCQCKELNCRHRYVRLISQQ